MAAAKARQRQPESAIETMPGKRLGGVFGTARHVPAAHAERIQHRRKAAPVQPDSRQRRFSGKTRRNASHECGPPFGRRLKVLRTPPALRAFMPALRVAGESVSCRIRLTISLCCSSEETLLVSDVTLAAIKTMGDYSDTWSMRPCGCVRFFWRPRRSFGCKARFRHASRRPDG